MCAERLQPQLTKALLTARVPAASSRHLTSSIMNIHNKSRARDVRWPRMRTEPLWAPPELSTDAVYQVYSFNSPTFLFPILVRPIACVLHAKKKENWPLLWKPWSSGMDSVVIRNSGLRRVDIASTAFWSHAFEHIKAYREKDKTQPYLKQAREW